MKTADLEAYLDEALPPAEMARIEKAAREDRALATQLASIHARRASGIQSLGEIWREHRLSCPSREQLGSYVLGALDDGHAAYIRFHLDVVGCRYCQANLADLRAQQAGGDATASRRRDRYFQSSASGLQGNKR
jgi:hypothetical protein